jgi:hypothetical protein
MPKPVQQKLLPNGAREPREEGHDGRG